MVALQDQDGSEQLQLELLNIPSQIVISDGTRQFVASSSNSRLDLTGWNLSQLSISVPHGYCHDIQLRVKATATEQSTGQSDYSAQPSQYLVTRYEDQLGRAAAERRAAETATVTRVAGAVGVAKLVRWYADLIDLNLNTPCLCAWHTMKNHCKESSDEPNTCTSLVSRT